MTRAIITQLVEALESGWSPQFTGKDARALSDAAITAAREYLATEPSGDRVELIRELRKRHDKRLVISPSMFSKAADMLEADAQQAYDQQAMDLCNVCGWKGIFPGEPCLVCAQQAKPTDWSAA